MTVHSSKRRFHLHRWPERWFLPFNATLGRRAIACAVLLAVLLAGQSVYAQESDAAAVADFNRQLLLLREGPARSVRTRGGRTVSGGAANPGAADLLRRRALALGRLIAADPAAALDLALSQTARAAIERQYPGSARWLESDIVAKGPVEHFVLDGPDLRVAGSATWMNLGGDNLELYFAHGVPEGLKSGVILDVRGIRLGSRVAVAFQGADGSVFSAASAAPQPIPNGPSKISTSKVNAAPVTAAAGSDGCSTVGQQNVAVLLVNLPGATPPFPPQQAYDVFFGSPGLSLNGYWQEASYGQTWAAGGVYGWYTMDRTYTCSELSQLRTDAINAAAADLDFSTVNRLFLVVPEVGCGWAGAASSCYPLSSPHGSFNASSTYVIDKHFLDRTKGVELVTHEGGHNFWLLHAGNRDFGTEALGPLGAAGTVSEMNDWFSTMGAWSLGHYGAPHKAETLGWLRPGVDYLTVETSGTFTITPAETPLGGYKALKVRRGSGNDAWLWIEYRQPIGDYDSTLPDTVFDSQVFSGALLHYEDSQTGQDRTQLLDFTPATDSWFDPALAVGHTWQDPYTSLSITVNGATASGLTVNVSFGSNPCNAGQPGVILSPDSQTISRGQTVQYTVSVTNNDSSGCAAGSFDLASSEPAGWASSVSPVSLALNPGQTATAMVTKTAPNNVSSGPYTVRGSAVHQSMVGADTAIAMVADAAQLAITLSLSSASYQPRDTVLITATVNRGTSPAAGAAVTFTLTRPDGSAASNAATTDSGGFATWSYRLRQNDPAGSYTVNANATDSSSAVGATPVTFTVAAASGGGGGGNGGGKGGGPKK